MKPSIMLLASFYTCIVAVMTSFERRNTRGGQTPKVYSGISTVHPGKVVSQLTRQVPKFVQIWDYKELQLPSVIVESSSGEDRNG